MTKIAVTGAPGCGKTTLIRRVVEELQERLNIGGIYTEEIREGGARKGFAIIDIATGRRGILAHVDLSSGPRMGKYRVNLRDIEGIAIPAIEEAWQHGDLVVIDEIAPMELKSPKFVETVARLLKSTKHMLFAIHRRADHPLLQRVREEFCVYEVTPANRERLVGEIVTAFTVGERTNG